MTTVQVLLGERSYPIRIRPGSLGDLGEALRSELEATRAVVPAGTAARLVALLERAGLPTAEPDSETQRGVHVRGLAVDKKLAGGRVGLIALREIGRAELVSLTVEEILAGTE